VSSNSRLGRDAAVEVARVVGEHIIKKVPHVQGVALGGGLAYREGTDPMSDIDVFPYTILSANKLPDAAQWATLATPEGMEVITFRNRNGNVELRLDGSRFGSDLPIDIKLYPLTALTRYLTQPPLLDELMLDQLHASKRYKVLAERDNTITQVLSELEQRSRGNIPILASRALDSYATTVIGAVKQRIKRDDRPDSAMHTGFPTQVQTAINMLTCLAYLQAGEYPAPLKWRYSAPVLGELPNGSQLHDLLSSYSRTSHPFEPRFALECVWEMEQLLAGDRDAFPWSAHDNPWWWMDYAPTEEFAAAYDVTRLTASGSSELRAAGSIPDGSRGLVQP
jgi:hypothetical protein